MTANDRFKNLRCSGLSSGAAIRRALILLVVFPGNHWAASAHSAAGCQETGKAVLSAAQPQETFDQYDLAAAETRDAGFVEPAVIGSGAECTAVDLSVVETVSLFNNRKLRHRSYNGCLVGPTIRVRPGQKLNVRLRNCLEAVPDPELSPGLSHSTNRPHGFNITNLHTHGLHVSPRSPADNVFLEIGPGQEFSYQFEIAADHPAGTFWYHAHRHGSTALQLSSGMAGALIVEGGLDEVPEIRAARERILVLQQFVTREGADGIDQIDAEALYGLSSEPVEAINGIVTPTIVMRPGEVQRWRIIHAGTTDAMMLDLEGIEFHEIAVDGLATGRCEARNSLQLYPGYRSDVLVQAPAADGTHLLYSVIRDAEKSIRNQTSQRRNLLRLVVTGQPVEMQLPRAEQLARHAAFGQDEVPSADELAVPREIQFLEDGNRFLVNDNEFDPDRIDHQPVLGTAEEWTLRSAGGTHPFHIHVNPFAVRPAVEGQPWVWRDTLTVTRSRPQIIRTRYSAFTGPTVLHCHNLVHEDLGMMQKVEIMPRPDGPGLQPAASTARATPDRLWSGKKGSGDPLSNEDYRGQRVLLVLHRGLGCFHCAAQLKTLQAQQDWFRKAGIELVAISPFLPAGAAADETLAGFSFPVLTDKELYSFRQFDCLDSSGEPKHGLFLIDANHRLLLEERSDVAVADPKSLILTRLPTLEKRP